MRSQSLLFKMESSFYHAKLTSENTINILVFTQLVRQSDDIYFFLVKDSKIVDKCSPIKCTSMNNVRFFQIKIEGGYEYGHHYEIFVPNFGAVPLDVSDAVYFPGFDDKFYYDGNDLGATYTKEKTTFALWAPLATTVAVTLYIDGEAQSFDMKRTDKGVYRAEVVGDFKNIGYQYVVTNSEIARRVNDPYAKSLTLNSKYSAIVDVDGIKKQVPLYENFKQVPISQASIYELNVRDFTIDSNTDIENKGKYLGLVEPNRKTKGGNPAGLDYLKFLGMSHVQLLPVLDFGNVKDDNPDEIYNWGYDVNYFFALEGSYSRHPEIPSERIVEFRTVVNQLHKNNIGVILDVVYNHIWSYESSTYEKILPGYFFRKNKQGRIYNGSGCGNDVATEHKMVRKMIIDSTMWLLDMFDIDGLRFDLMGLIDIDTMNELTAKLKGKKPNFYVYGEGWSIPTGLPGDKQTTIGNSFKCEDIGFFNDSYRDILKGSTFDMSAKGYVNGATDYVGGVFFAMMATANDYVFPARFKYASQSINYVECHDNATLFDKLSYSLPEEEEEILLKRVKFANALIGFSFGVPFYHMGQEIGLSKHMEDNTYNMGDEYNKFDYSILDKRFDMARYFSDILKFRQLVGIYDEKDPKEIAEILDFETFTNYSMKISVKNAFKNGSDALLIINPNNEPLYYELDDYYCAAFTNSGIAKKELMMKHVTHSPFSVVWLIRK